MDVFGGAHPGEVRGSGCKNDGGPLWVTVTLLDDPIVAQGMDQMFVDKEPYNSTIWARFYQENADPSQESNATIFDQRNYARFFDNFGSLNQWAQTARPGDEDGAGSTTATQPTTTTSAKPEHGELVECLRVALCTTASGM